MPVAANASRDDVWVTHRNGSHMRRKIYEYDTTMNTINQSEWTDKQQSCIDALAVFAKGRHHMRSVRPFGDGVSMLWWSDLSTHDGCDLTRLVFVAHAFGVRISIEQGAPGTVKIVAFKRSHGDREAMKFWEWHQNLENLRETVNSWISEMKSDDDSEPTN